MQNNGLNAQVLKLIEEAPQIKQVQQEAQTYLSQFKGLAIVDVETYKSAKAYFSEVRKTRLYLEKTFGAATTALKVLVKNYDKQAGEVIKLYKQTEADIKAKVQRVDDEAKAEKEREQYEKLQKFNARTDALFSAGYTFNGHSYTCGALNLTTDKIESMSDDEFNEKIEAGRAEADRIAAIMEAMAQVGVEEQTAPPEVPELEQPKEAPASATTFDDFLAPLQQPAPKQENPPPVFEAPENTNYTPPGFSAGFDACKNKVLELLATNEKLTRASLIAKIEALKANG